MNIDSTMQFEQFVQFNLTLFSLISISSKQSFLTNIPAPYFLAYNVHSKEYNQ